MCISTIRQRFGFGADRVHLATSVSRNNSRCTVLQGITQSSKLITGQQEGQ